MLQAVSWSKVKIGIANSKARYKCLEHHSGTGPVSAVTAKKLKFDSHVTGDGDARTPSDRDSVHINKIGFGFR